jgi:integrase
VGRPINLPGRYNNHGTLFIRLWPWPKRERPNPYVEKIGCVCDLHETLLLKRLAEIRQQIKDGQFNPTKTQDMLFTDVLDIFFRKHYVEKKRSQGSRNGMDARINTWKAYKGFKGRLYHTLTPSDFRLFADHRRKLGNGGWDVKRHLGDLQSVFNCVADWVKLGDIPNIKQPVDTQGHFYNPVEPVERPSGEELVKRDRIATRDELKSLKDWCFTQGRDIDLWVLIERALISFLRKSDLDAVNGQRAKGFAGKTGKLFDLPVEFGRRLHTSDRERRWAAAKTACSIVNLHWHDLRHTGATMARQAGVTLEMMQEALQHSSVKQTFDYLNERAERLRPIVDTVQRELQSL